MGAHDGHRARKRKQFQENGLEIFPDHEVLELLLYFAVPRVDTSPLAHRLLEHFGSLEAVLSAPMYELKQIKGMGDGGATLISLILPLVRRARTEASRKMVILNTSEDAGAYFSELLFGLRDERMYEACLDAKGKVLRCAVVADGTTDTMSIDLHKITELARHCSASGVVLAHNHPSGVALPSEDDKAATVLAGEALRKIGVQLVDHIIVADGDCVSMRDSGMLLP